MVLSLLFLALLCNFSLQFKDIPNGCSVLYEGCNITQGQCACGRTIDKCTNTFQYRTLDLCTQALFQPSSSLEDLSEYPLCLSAQYRPICNSSHVGTKYCHGSCEAECCVVTEDGCLPPTNIYVPASACAAAHQDVCQEHGCRKGFKCESMKTEECPVLPCKKQPTCVVDDDFDPCPLVTCPQGRKPKICTRRRTECGKEKCPFTFSCELVSSFVRNSNRRAIKGSKDVYQYRRIEHGIEMRSQYRTKSDDKRSYFGCPNCPRMSIQESYCKNHFAVRIRINELIFSKRFYKSLGLCDWYSSTVEYVVRSASPRIVQGNVILLVKRNATCPCLPYLTLGERYMIIGMELGGVYDNMPQIFNVPRDGFIKSWHVVKKRHQLFNFGDCPTYTHP